MGLISDVPETLSENLPDAVQFIVSPCTSFFITILQMIFSRNLANWLGIVIPYYIVFSLGLVHIGDYVYILDIWVLLMKIISTNYDFFALATQIPSFVC